MLFGFSVLDIALGRSVDTDAMKKYWWTTPFIAVSLVWLAYQYWLPSVIVLLDTKGRDLSGAGTFGDSFGALNTLFSGLAFAGIIISIVLQSKELRETREELKGQKLQLERQAFENAFFQMLRLHNEIVDAFRYRSPVSAREFSGKECFGAIKSDITPFLTNARFGAAVEDRYEKFYVDHAHWNLGHYFRNLYQIVKYVHNTELPNKKFYTNIIRAQLSSDELFLLFFNALSTFGREKFLPLIVEYELLEHLPQQTEIVRADVIRFGARAFGDSPQWRAVLQG